ncbi:hypothetical protein P9112_008953 [Eukaryota sp. TZLM1-RC]
MYSPQTISNVLQCNEDASSLLKFVPKSSLNPSSSATEPNVLPGHSVSCTDVINIKSDFTSVSSTFITRLVCHFAVAKPCGKQGKRVLVLTTDQCFPYMSYYYLLQRLCSHYFPNTEEAEFELQQALLNISVLMVNSPQLLQDASVAMNNTSFGLLVLQGINNILFNSFLFPSHFALKTISFRLKQSLDNILQTALSSQTCVVFSLVPFFIYTETPLSDHVMGSINQFIGSWLNAVTLEVSVEGKGELSCKLTRATKIIEELINIEDLSK